MSRTRSLLFWSAGVAAAPLLALQARRARRRAPRLSPASGDREGRVHGPGSALELAVVGDSTAVGVGVERSRDSLAARLAEEIAERAERSVRWRAVGRPGARAAHLVGMIEELGRADLVVVTVGVNDVTALTRLDRWRDDLEAVIDRLERRGVERTVLAGLPPMGTFPALPRPLRDWIGVRSRMLDDALGEVVAERPGVRRLRFDGAVRRGAMAPDGYHPGVEGYAGWARALAALALDGGGVSTPESAP